MMDQGSDYWFQHLEKGKKAPICDSVIIMMEDLHSLLPEIEEVHDRWWAVYLPVCG